MDLEKELALLIDSRFPIVTVETWEEERIEGLVRRVTDRLEIPFFTWTALKGICRDGNADSIHETERPLGALEYIERLGVDSVYLFKDFHHYLQDPAVLRKLRDICGVFRRKRKSIVLLSPRIEVPVDLAKDVVDLEIPLPTEREMAGIVEKVVRHFQAAEPGLGLDPDDETRRAISRALVGLTLVEAERLLVKAITRDQKLDQSDLAWVLDAKRQVVERSGLLEYYPREERFETVGGLSHLKAWLGRRKRAFTPEAKAFGIDPPRGVLLLGVPGCGKSLSAKAVAGEWSLPLIKLDPSRLYSKYVGETEGRLRDALHLTESVAPAVLWIDEIEKGLSYGNMSDVDGGVSARVFGTFLSWLQERPAPVFVVATSNDVASLPPELFRKGRFDEVFFVDLPPRPARKEIFAIHIRKRKRDPGRFDLEALAGKTEGFSGGEIEQVVVSGLYAAFEKGAELSTDDLLREIPSTVPLSVTMREGVESLRRWAKSRTVPADGEEDGR